MDLFLKAFVWNTFGPIAESAEIVFDWSDVDIGMFGNYGNIAYMVAVLPMCYFMDVKGMYVYVYIFWLGLFCKHALAVFLPKKDMTIDMTTRINITFCSVLIIMSRNLYVYLNSYPDEFLEWICPVIHFYELSIVTFSSIKM